MALPTEKRSPLRSWPDYALFLAAAAFFIFSAKIFTRQPAGPAVPAPSEVSRGPASVSHDESAPERTTHTVEFSCQDEKFIRATTEASLLRLTAAGCGGRIQRITNQSTGESLMLFERNGGVTTHYFPLKEGANRILIEWKGAKKSAKLVAIEKS